MQGRGRVSIRVDMARRLRLWASFGALLLLIAQAAMAAHAVETDHALTGPGDCLICLHGDRDSAAPPPDAALASIPVHFSPLKFPFPQDRPPVRAVPGAHGARAPPLHSSTA